jgi:hypothetical protein
MRGDGISTFEIVIDSRANSTIFTSMRILKALRFYEVD